MNQLQSQTNLTSKIPRPNNTQVVEALRKEASTNAVFNAVCHVFAIRERARQQVTVGSLTLRMAQEGYNYKKAQYQNVLKFLSTLGIGTLEYGQGNEIKALKNIRLTLQSIGRAAVTSNQNLEKFNPAFDYKELQAPEMRAAIMAPNKPAPQPPPIEPGIEIPKPDKRPPRKPLPQYAAAITVTIDNTPVTFDLPKGLTTKQLGELLAMLHAKDSQ